jgi:hypothetical protein
MAKRSEIVSANPDAKITQIMTLLGASWKELDEAGKQIFKDKNTEEREAYDKARAEGLVVEPSP